MPTLFTDSTEAKGIKVFVSEPVLDETEFFGSEVIKDLEVFKQRSDLILSNRLTPDIHDIADKVYTRDLFNSDA